MDNYLKRALELGRKESDSIEILTVYENDVYLVATLVTPELVKNDSGMDYFRYAINKHSKKEYFGIGYGFLFKEGFEDLKLNELKEINIESRKSA